MFSTAAVEMDDSPDDDAVSKVTLGSFRLLCLPVKNKSYNLLSLIQTKGVKH